jgi:hypothetical protein
MVAHSPAGVLPGHSLPHVPHAEICGRAANLSGSSQSNPHHPQHQQYMEQSVSGQGSRPLPPSQTSIQRRQDNAVQISESGSARDGPASFVTFWLHYRAEFGQRICIVGNTDSLGSWVLRNGPEMKWGEGHKWSVTVEVPAGGIVEYKYVVLQPDGLHPLQWQEGNNAVLAIMVCPRPRLSYQRFSSKLIFCNCAWPRSDEESCNCRSARD